MRIFYHCPHQNGIFRKTNYFHGNFAETALIFDFDDIGSRSPLSDGASVGAIVDLFWNFHTGTVSTGTEFSVPVWKLSFRCGYFQFSRSRTCYLSYEVSWKDV